MSDLDVAQHLSRADDAGLRYRGFLAAPTAGLWTFSVECDTGALLRLHDILVVDDDALHSGAAASGSVRLAAGLHPLRLSYRTGRDAPSLVVRWSGPTVGAEPVPASALVRADRSIGAPYCASNANSTGAASETYVEGSPVLFDDDDDVTLVAEGLPRQSFGYFLASRTQGFVANPGGSQGNLCLGGAIGRFSGPGQVLDSGRLGRLALRIDLARIPTPTGPIAIAPGESWNFQAWHRDANPAPTSNLTGAATVTFL